jgi:hypothetical protein
VTALSAKNIPRLNLAQSIRRHIDPLDGVDLALPPRQVVRRPSNFRQVTVLDTNRPSEF